MVYSAASKLVPGSMVTYYTVTPDGTQLGEMVVFVDSYQELEEWLKEYEDTLLDVHGKDVFANLKIVAVLVDGGRRRLITERNVPCGLIGYVFDDGGRKKAGYKGRTTDCIVRAIAIATQLPYEEVYKRIADMRYKWGYSRTGKGGRLPVRPMPQGFRRPKKETRMKRYMKAFGFQKVRLPRGPKPTYTEAYKKYGNCIVKTTKHICALREGALHDTFDGRTSEYDGILGQRKATSIWVPSETYHNEPC